MLGFLKKKKKETPSAPPTGNEGADVATPTERVRSLSSQGLSEPEIIKVLKEEGYTPSEADKAMKEALKGAVKTPPTQPAGFAREEQPPAAPGTKERLFSGEMTSPELPSTPVPYEEFERIGRGPKEGGRPDLPEFPGEAGSKPPAEEYKEPEFERELEEEIPRLPESGRSRREKRYEKRREIEELAETIVEEKWETFRKEMDDVITRFRELEGKITSLEQNVNRLQGEKKTELEEIKNKIDTYKDSISEASSRIEAVERALKDSLTPMMQSIRSLSDAIKTFKTKK